MEDLNVHETNAKVSKESSASVLGAMLPTVPPDKKILKKEGMIDMIPEELMEFIYNENATYTYAVEGAIANIAHNVKDKLNSTEHAKDLKTNSLPFKVRQLTIERATLKVKISWMVKRKSKQEKVNKYRVRLAEVEKALRKIQNAVNNDADKKEMERQIKELDTSIVKQTSKELEQRGVLESVNHFIRAGKEEGFILSTMEEFTIEELYPSEKEEPVTEGANLNMASALADAKLKSSKALKRAKKAIKKGNYDEAANYIKSVKEYVKSIEEQVKDYPHDSLSTNFIGALIGWITYTLISTLKSLGINVGAFTGVAATGGATVGTMAVAATRGASDDVITALTAGVGITGAGLVGVATGVAGAAAFIINIIGVLRRFKANIDESSKKKKDIDITFLNGLYNRCLVYLKDTYKALDKLENGLKKAKAEVEKAKKEAEKETKESTAFTILDAIVDSHETTFESELVKAFEGELMDESSFLELMLEAKKPDEGMMDILSTLNGKGYKTKYSCSGHKDSGKSDKNDDGIVNGKLTSSARIMFQDDYDFPDPPKHWGFKTVEGKDYLYVLPYSSDGKDPKAFDAWKNKYMASLDRWAKSLPNVKTAEKVITKPEEEKTPKESDVTESVDYNAAIDNELAMLLMDTVDLF